MPILSSKIETSIMDNLEPSMNLYLKGGILGSKAPMPRRGSGGGPRGPGPPLTLGFEAPELSIFGPYLIFP